MTTVIRQLRETITNPHPDRRSKDWNKLPTIPAGSQFIDNGSSLWGGRRFTFETENTDLGKLILANSDVVPPKTPRELAECHIGYYYAESILESLVKLGRIGPVDFIAIAELDAKEEEAQKAG